MSFLLAVGEDLSRTPQQMQRIIDTVVHDNWFEDVDDLRTISDKQWDDWKIPVNFVNKLRSKLAEETQRELDPMLDSGPLRLRGKLVDYRPRLGFGFITRDDGEGQLFCPSNNFAEGLSRTSLGSGDVVEFVVGRDPKREGKLLAEDVRLRSEVNNSE